MVYDKTVTLKDGRICTLRNGTEQDGKKLLDIFMLTHEQTDYLLSYPDENTNRTVEEEAEFLRKATESSNSIEILAEVNGTVVGSADIHGVGSREKIRHRAEMGVSVDQAYWGLGIGRNLVESCIECARKAGYEQVELEAVADNRRAITLYQKEGFVEYGRNPKGFRSRLTGWQPIVLMRLDLNEEK